MAAFVCNCRETRKVEAHTVCDVIVFRFTC